MLRYISHSVLMIMHRKNWINHYSLLTFQVLLSAHPSLLTHGDAKGAAPLHHASIHKATHFLELILSYKLPKKSPVSLDINCKNHSGRTPLHCAVAYNVLQNVTLLATRGAQVEAVDNEGKTPVDYANNLGDGDRELMLAALQAGSLYGHSTIWTLVSIII